MGLCVLASQSGKFAARNRNLSTKCCDLASFCTDCMTGKHWRRDLRIPCSFSTGTAAAARTSATGSWRPLHLRHERHGRGVDRHLVLCLCRQAYILPLPQEGSSQGRILQCSGLAFTGLRAVQQALDGFDRKLLTEERWKSFLHVLV